MTWRDVSKGLKEIDVDKTHGIGRDTGEQHDCPATAYGDDRLVSATFDQNRECSSHHVVRATDVDGPCSPPLVGIVVPHRAQLPEMTGIIDNNVQPAKRFFDLLDGSCDLIILGYVYG